MDPIASNISVLTGLSVALIAIVLIMLIVLVRFINSFKQSASAPQAAFASQPAISLAKSAGGEVIAVISAAVAAYMDSASPGVPYKITQVTPSAARVPRGIVPRPVWGSAGLRQNTEPF